MPTRGNDFYQPHLDRVSRSFALCIQQLPQPLRDRVALSYLLCRVLDTVEDSPWHDVGLRAEQDAQLEAFVRALPGPGEVERWAARFPAQIPEGERLLLADARALLTELHGLEPSVAGPIRETVLRMAAGMRHHAARDGALRLTHLAEVNRYCYFVAGVVGELLTALFLLDPPASPPPPALRRDAIHFGLFLQKVNLLKDQREDEREGRFLVPDREQLLASLRENGQGAIDYLTALPTSARGYRVFCAWSLFLGLGSLPFIAEGAKIPRSATLQLLAAIEPLAQDDAALRKAGDEALARLPVLGAVAPTLEDEVFARLSHPALSHADRVALRLL